MIGSEKRGNNKSNESDVKPTPNDLNLSLKGRETGKKIGGLQIWQVFYVKEKNKNKYLRKMEN